MIGNDIYNVSEGINIIPICIGYNGEVKKFKVNIVEVTTHPDNYTVIKVMSKKYGPCEFYYNGVHEAFKCGNTKGADKFYEAVESYDIVDAMFDMYEDSEVFNKKWQEYLDEVTDLATLEETLL